MQYSKEPKDWERSSDPHGYTIIAYVLFAVFLVIGFALGFFVGRITS